MGLHWTVAPWKMMTTEEEEVMMEEEITVTYVILQIVMIRAILYICR
jgi:hypothetical protein